MTMASKTFFITGANRGIGFHTVKRLLNEVQDSFVYLGTRKVSNGVAAIEVSFPFVCFWTC